MGGTSFFIVVLLASAVPLPLVALRRAATAAVPREQVLER
jgi:hypothetical protein